MQAYPPRRPQLPSLTYQHGEYSAGLPLVSEGDEQRLNEQRLDERSPSPYYAHRAPRDMIETIAPAEENRPAQATSEPGTCSTRLLSSRDASPRVATFAPKTTPPILGAPEYEDSSSRREDSSNSKEATTAASDETEAKGPRLAGIYMSAGTTSVEAAPKTPGASLSCGDRPPPMFPKLEMGHKDHVVFHACSDSDDSEFDYYPPLSRATSTGLALIRAADLAIEALHLSEPTEPETRPGGPECLHHLLPGRCPRPTAILAPKRSRVTSAGLAPKRSCGPFNTKAIEANMFDVDPCPTRGGHKAQEGHLAYQESCQGIRNTQCGPLTRTVLSGDSPQVLG